MHFYGAMVESVNYNYIPFDEPKLNRMHTNSNTSDGFTKMLCVSILTFVSEIVEQNKKIIFPDLSAKLTCLDIKGLPPGGGLAAK